MTDGESYHIKVEQLSGYVLYPTIQEWNVRAEAGHEYTETITD